MAKVCCDECYRYFCPIIEVTVELKKNPILSKYSKKISFLVNLEENEQIFSFGHDPVQTCPFCGSMNEKETNKAQIIFKSEEIFISFFKRFGYPRSTKTTITRNRGNRNGCCRIHPRDETDCEKEMSDFGTILLNKTDKELNDGTHQEKSDLFSPLLNKRVQKLKDDERLSTDISHPSMLSCLLKEEDEDIYG